MIGGVMIGVDKHGEAVYSSLTMTQNAQTFIGTTGTVRAATAVVREREIQQQA